VSDICEERAYRGKVTLTGYPTPHCRSPPEFADLFLSPPSDPLNSAFSLSWNTFVKAASSVLPRRPGSVESHRRTWVLSIDTGKMGSWTPQMGHEPAAVESSLLFVRKGDRWPNGKVHSPSWTHATTWTRGVSHWFCGIQGEVVETTTREGEMRVYAGRGDGTGFRCVAQIRMDGWRCGGEM